MIGAREGCRIAMMDLLLLLLAPTLFLNRYLIDGGGEQHTTQERESAGRGHCH